MIKNKLNIDNNYLFWISVILVFVWGCYLRINLFFENYLLDCDEIMLAISVLKSNLIELSRSLKFDQISPPLFNILTYFIVKFLGNETYVFRLIPLFSSIGSLILIVPIAMRMFKSEICVFLALIFAANDPMLIFYSSFFKAYSSDVFICLLIIFLYYYFKFKSNNFKSVLLYGILSFMLASFSIPAFFLFFSVFIISLFNNKKITLSLFASFFGVAAAFLWNYIMFYNLKEFYNNGWLMWKNGYLDFSIKSIDMILTNFINNFSIELSYKYIILFLAIMGLVFFIKEKREEAYIIFLTLLLTAIASYFKMYSMYHRLILFLQIPMILFILKPIDYAFNFNGNNAKLTIFLKYFLIFYISFITINVDFNSKQFNYYSSIEERVKLKSIIDDIVLHSEKYENLYLQYTDFFIDFYSLKYNKSVNYKSIFDINDEILKKQKTIYMLTVDSEDIRKMQLFEKVKILGKSYKKIKSAESINLYVIE